MRLRMTMKCNFFSIPVSVFCEYDKMNSLASAVMYGKLAKIGSGSVIIRNKINNFMYLRM